MRSPALWLALALAGGLSAASQERLPVAEFSRGSLAGWEEERFSGRTDYRLAPAPGAEGSALRATTRSAASGLYREIRVDLERTPWLHWSWRVDQVYAGLDETTRQGDDYPARIYLVVSGGLRFWRTRALNYVWSSGQPEGRLWPNAFSANARLLAVESGPAHVGEWRHYRRNARADLERAFGEPIREIHALALMSDSDNGGQAAVAWYGDIWFSAE